MVLLVIFNINSITLSLCSCQDPNIIIDQEIEISEKLCLDLILCGENIDDDAKLKFFLLSNLSIERIDMIEHLIKNGLKINEFDKIFNGKRNQKIVNDGDDGVNIRILEKLQSIGVIESYEVVSNNSSIFSFKGSDELKDYIKLKNKMSKAVALG